MLLREIVSQAQSQSVNIVRRRMVIWRESHQDIGIGGSDRSGVAIGKIDTAIGQSNVIDNALRFSWRNLRRMEFSTRSQRKAVSSMRMPVGPRR